MKRKRVISIMLVVLLSFSFLITSYGFTERQSKDYIPSNEGGYNPMPYYNYDGILNCMFYTWGRVHEKVGISLSSSVSKWYQGKDLYQVPQANSIAFWGTPGNITHTAYVESYSNNTVYFTEGGYIPTKGFHEGSMTLNNFKNRPGLSFYGFVYLNAPVVTTKNVWVYNNPARQGTTLSGYKYNTDIQWDKDSRSVHGYYLTVERLNKRGSYPIRETITSNPDETWTDIYGLSSESYIVTIQSIGGNHELINSHRTKLLVTNYNGTSYMNDYN